VKGLSEESKENGEEKKDKQLDLNLFTCFPTLLIFFCLDIAVSDQLLSFLVLTPELIGA